VSRAPYVDDAPDHARGRGTRVVHVLYANHLGQMEPLRDGDGEVIDFGKKYHGDPRPFFMHATDVAPELARVLRAVEFDHDEEDR